MDQEQETTNAAPTIRVKQFVPPTNNFMKLQSTTPVTAPIQHITPAPGVQIKGPGLSSQPQVIHSLPKPIAKPFGSGKGFLTGGLSQIAPPKQYQYEEQDSLEEGGGLDEQHSHIIEEEQSGEEDEGNYDEDSLTRKPKEVVIVKQQPSIQGDGEVKVTVHNKQLLMDVLMGDGDSQLKNEIDEKPKRKMVQASGQGISGIQRVKKPVEEKTYSGMMNVAKKNPEVSYPKQQQPKATEAILPQSLSQRKLIEPVMINQPVSNSNPINQLQTNNSFTFNPTYQQPQQLPIPQQQPSVNQINFVQNQNQFNAGGNTSAPVQQAPLTYTEQIQQQLNMIMQMHSQQLMAQGQAYPQPMIQPPMIQQPQMINPQQQNLTDQLFQLNMMLLQQQQLLSQNGISGGFSLGQPPMMPSYPIMQNQQQPIQQLYNPPPPQIPQNYQQPQSTTIQTGKPIYSNYLQPNPLDHFKNQNYAQGSLMSQLMKEQVENQNKPQSKAQKSKPVPSQNETQSSTRQLPPKDSPAKSVKSYISANSHQQLPRNSYAIPPQMRHVSQTDAFQQYNKEGETDSDSILGGSRRKVQSQTRPSFTAAQTGQSIINNGNYKPYTQKEFNSMQQQVLSKKMGGLGPNIGGEEWEKARQKQKAIQEFAQNIKTFNQFNNLNGTKLQRQQSQDAKPPVQKPKEKTAREKGMEFAKHVPKPKTKIQPSQGKETKTEIEEDENNGLEDHIFNGGIRIGQGSTDRAGQNQVLQMLDQRHQAYSDEVQRIKRTFGFNM